MLNWNQKLSEHCIVRQIDLFWFAQLDFTKLTVFSFKRYSHCCLLFIKAIYIHLEIYNDVKISQKLMQCSKMLTHLNAQYKGRDLGGIQFISFWNMSRDLTFFIFSGTKQQNSRGQDLFFLCIKLCFFGVLKFAVFVQSVL